MFFVPTAEFEPATFTCRCGYLSVLCSTEQM